MDKTQHKTGKILPFRQDVDFFLKRGAKELDRNDPLAAIQHYRKAYDSDPADLDSCLALAELLSQMQRFEESNRLLLIDMSMNDPDPESYFGLACNYYGMQEFSYAHESLETYLHLEPDGFYAYDIGSRQPCARTSWACCCRIAIASCRVLQQVDVRLGLPVL